MIIAAHAKTYAEFTKSKEESDPKIIEEVRYVRKLDVNHSDGANRAYKSLCCLQKIDLANQVASILRSNIVQGVKKEDQKDVDVYELKFHSGIELGDNDSIRKAKGSHRKSKKQQTSGCCGEQ